MSTIEPISILLCGKIPGHVQAAKDIVKPEFEVIKHCSSTSEAQDYISTTFSSSSANVDKPKVIVMGGGFSQEDFSAVYDSAPGAKSVPWLRPAHFKSGAVGEPPAGGPPPAEAVARRLRKALEEHLEDVRAGKGEGEIWWM